MQEQSIQCITFVQRSFDYILYMQAIQKQKQFELPNKIKISSNFECGNLAGATQAENNQINLWIGSDPKSHYRTWFYFSIENMHANTIITFNIMNMSNQVKLFKQGLVPVFKNEKNTQWRRIKIPIPSNAVVKGDEGYKVTFKHLFEKTEKHWFAFTFPWSVSECDSHIQHLVNNHNTRLFCSYDDLTLTSQNRKVKLLTVTSKTKANLVELDQIQKAVFMFPKKPGIFISARVHPGQVAASHIMNGILESLFSGSPLAMSLLEHYVFYIVPIINPDGVANGNFRTDSRGNNLNRFYSNPSKIEQPEIYAIKNLLVQMVQLRRISFCLDLHAHVNKQGAFIYGNCIPNLQKQTQTCLFPKILSLNCEYFDYESCNFSEKNMQSKDKIDELSKEGASRVAIYKETGLAECWTLECNYNSSKIINILTKPTIQNKNNNVSNAVITSQVGPEQKQQLKLFNLSQFQRMGYSLVQSISDYYQLRQTSRIYSMRLKNMQNLKLNTAVYALRLLPYRFDDNLRKILNNLNSQIKLNQCLSYIHTLLSPKALNKTTIRTGQKNKTTYIKRTPKHQQYKLSEKEIKIEIFRTKREVSSIDSRLISSKILPSSTIRNNCNQVRLRSLKKIIERR